MSAPSNKAETALCTAGKKGNPGELSDESNGCIGVSRKSTEIIFPP